MNEGREHEVVEIFCRWLQKKGWNVTREVNFADILGTRGDQRLIVEAKGMRWSPGLDIDTLYGQLLRRMAEAEGTRCAVLVPEKLVDTAARVPKQIRNRLCIDLYGVGIDDAIHEH